ncbi:MAG: helix-turn-helix domain-containing protein [Rectinema subterraneum]|jgi:AraC-like DNA-binding protein/mannose-6-phosphate isomerase-like protein (cupin superfamily)
MEVSSRELSSAVLSFWDSVSFDRISIKFCERFDGQSRIWNFQKHSHELFEFLYFIEGRAQIAAGPDNIDVSLFELVIYPPNVPHEEHLNKSFRQEIYCFWIDAGPCCSFDRGFSIKDQDGAIRAVMDGIYREYVSQKAMNMQIIGAYFRMLYLLVRRALMEPPNNDDSLVERCLGFIHEHYTEDFDISTMAHAVYVSDSYLFRSFKKKMSMTPMHYRNKLRIEKSKLLLCQSDRRLDLIAEDVGFDDVKYFSRLFKKATGMTPGAFRKQNRTPG